MELNVKLSLFLGLAFLISTPTQAGQALKNLDTAKMKAQTITAAKAVARIQPLLEQLAKGQIDSLKASLATDEWKNIIADLQSYIASTKTDLTAIVENLPAAQTYKGKLGLLDDAAGQLNGLLIPTKKHTLTKALNTLKDDAGFQALQPKLASYFKSKLEPMFAKLKDSDMPSAIEKVITFAKAKAAGEKTSLLAAIPSLLRVYNFVDSLLGVLEGACEFCLVANEMIRSGNLQLADSVVAILKTVMNRSYEFRIDIVNQINTLIQQHASSGLFKLKQLPKPAKPEWAEAELKAGAA